MTFCRKWLFFRSRYVMHTMLAGIVVGASSLAHGAESGSARGETEKLVATYRACCEAKGRHGPKTCATVDPFFDFAHLAQTTLAPLRKKLSPAQQKRLVSALHDVFARTARESGKALCDTVPTIADAKAHPKGSEVAIEVLEPGEDVPTRLAFVWRKAGERWRVIDLELEGGSLVTDYQNQFSRIQSKEGGAGLIRRIEARRANQDESATAADHGNPG